MTNPYIQRLDYKKMPIEDAILLLQNHLATGGMEFATVSLSNKPFKQWKKEQVE